METPSVIASSAVRVRYAGFWRRVVASVIDMLVITLVSWFLTYAVLGLFYGVERLLGGEPVGLPTFAEAFSSVRIQILSEGLYFCAAFPYYVWGTFKWGTTLGKGLVGVVVVDRKTAGPVTLKQSMIRFFSYLLSYLPAGAGFLMAAFHPQKLTFHDLAAGTVSVVRKRGVA